MTTPAAPSKIEKAARRVWKSAQMYIGFHKDRNGQQRDTSYVWKPKNGDASIHGDPSEKEAFIVVKSADRDSGNDVQIKLRPDALVVRRDSDHWWQGIQIKEDTILVRTAENVFVKIGPDGTVTRQTETDETVVDYSGSVFKKTEFTEAFMSGDGVDLKRTTPDNIAAITGSGVVSKSR